MKILFLYFVISKRNEVNRTYRISMDDMIYEECRDAIVKIWIKEERVNERKKDRFN